VDFYVKHQAFEGEVLMQADDPQVEAPALLAQLADEVFDFEVLWLD
jgi:hypothetical protein